MQRKIKNICRFNYPQPPVRLTQILCPADADTPPAVIKSSKKLYRDIKNKLNDLKEGENTSFDQLLVDLSVSKAKYILAIRSSLNCPTIFFKKNQMS